MRFIDVMKAKKRREKKERRARAIEMSEVRLNNAFKARVLADLEIIETVFSDDDVDYVQVNVPKEHIARFEELLFREEMADYQVTKLGETEFNIQRKVIEL